MKRNPTNAKYVRETLRERLDEIPPPVCAGRLLPTSEVTLGESAAANPEYADFHCAGGGCLLLCACASDGGAHTCVRVRAPYCFDFIVGHGQSAGPPLTIPPYPPTQKTTAVGPHASMQTGGRRVEGDLEYKSHLFNSGLKKQNRRGCCKCALHSLGSSNVPFHTFSNGSDINRPETLRMEPRFPPRQGGEQSIQMGWKRLFTLAPSPSSSRSSAWKRLGAASSSCSDWQSAESSSRHSEPTPLVSKLSKSSFSRSS